MASQPLPLARHLIPAAARSARDDSDDSAGGGTRGDSSSSSSASTGAGVAQAGARSSVDVPAYLLQGGGCRFDLCSLMDSGKLDLLGASERQR